MTPLKRKAPEERISCITYPEPGAIGRTGDWRIFRPILDQEKCTGCQSCWLFCPDAAISLDKDGKPIFNLEWCKGCMICEEVCPVKAITRIRETEAEK